MQSNDVPKMIKPIIMRMKIERMVKTWKKMAKKSRHRVNILKEWEVTEQAYINDLKIIIKRIQDPLVAAEIISEQEDRILFPNLYPMLKLS